MLWQNWCSLYLTVYVWMQWFESALHFRPMTLHYSEKKKRKWVMDVRRTRIEWTLCEFVCRCVCVCVSERSFFRKYNFLFAYVTHSPLGVWAFECPVVCMHPVWLSLKYYHQSVLHTHCIEFIAMEWEWEKGKSKRDRWQNNNNNKYLFK